MIRFDQVSLTYPGATQPIIDNLSLEIPEGELVLVVGRTGSGKSTILQCINGLVPHFTGGTMRGTVSIDGRSTRDHPPRALADLVGFVPQDPMSGFVTDVAEEEFAYGMECLGLPAEIMRRRVEETLDLLGLADVRDRPLRTLSAGQRQRVAIGAALAAHPRVLVLDEPTSALDPGAAEEVLAALHRLVHDLNVTVVMAEHRLERVVQYADRIVVVPGEGAPIVSGVPSTIMGVAPIAPPIVELGKLLNWDPLPLTVRDARRAAAPLRDLLIGRTPPLRLVHGAKAETLIDAQDASATYGSRVALRDVSFRVRRGEIVALMGRNGAGKSTLLNTIVGLKGLAKGSVRVLDVDPRSLKPQQLLRHVGLVPAEPTDLLEAASVAEECRASDRDAHAEPGTTRALLALLAPHITDDTHPGDVSEGQRLLLALAIVLAARPPLLLLDEPTRGLDYPTKMRLVSVLRDLAHAGHGIVLATHDVELAAEVATRVIVLAEGEVVADGSTADVVVASPMFAPQVAKVLAPGPWLTVSDVSTALEEDAG